MLFSKKILKYLEKNSLIKFILFTAVVISSFITIIKFCADAKNTIFITGDISGKLETISAGENIGYFREQFGREILSETINEHAKEVLFIYKTSYIQAVIDSDDKVVFYSVTDCINPIKIYNPAFDASYIDDKKYYPDNIILNETTFANFFRHSKNVHLSISGATANSYYYEYEYGANPGGYQTFFAGINDVCRFPKVECNEGVSFCDLPLIEDEDVDIKKLRNNNTITTYGEMVGGLSKIEITSLLDKRSIYLGPDRIKIRTLKLAHHFQEKNIFEKVFRKADITWKKFKLYLDKQNYEFITK